MKLPDPTARTLDDLWAAAEGACRWRGLYWSFMGILPHSGVGFQAVAMGADEVDCKGRYIEGHHHSPRLAIMAFLDRMESEPRFTRADEILAPFR